ncbi:MAG: DUF3368 domain-containing protein [Euryarchaeota archaeon]|nr:DUF3368 domain-containing protein [Euryarchaeota archaeon]
MIVVSNSSPLIAFSRICKLGLLKDLFGTIIIPGEVFTELAIKEHEFSQNRIDVRPVANKSLVKSPGLRLDRGESAAIALASELGSDLLLMDERPGRRIAEYMEIEVAGTVALLVKLARSGKIEIREELDNLIRKDFWLSKKLYRWALEAGGATQ